MKYLIISLIILSLYGCYVPKFSVSGQEVNSAIEACKNDGGLDIIRTSSSLFGFSTKIYITAVCKNQKTISYTIILEKK